MSPRSNWRGRLETRMAQAQDLGAFVRKAADEAVRPVQERSEKFTKVVAQGLHPSSQRPVREDGPFSCADVLNNRV